MRRTLISWISTMIRLSMWVVILALGAYVWQRGFDKSLEDFGWVWGLLEGLGDEGQRVGGQRARGREYEAKRMKQAQAGRRGRTRGAGW